MNLNVGVMVSRRICRLLVNITGSLGQRKWTERLFICQRSFISTLPSICERARDHDNRVALVDDLGEHSYKQIYGHSLQLAGKIASLLPPAKIGDQQRVAFLTSSDASFVVAQWSCWLSGHIALPLSKSHPDPMLDYFIGDAQSKLIIATPDFADKAHRISNNNNHIPVIIVNPKEYISESPKHKEISNDTGLEYLKPSFLKEADAMILYTSGTTGPPKGVVLSQYNLIHQMKSLITSWKLSHDDVLLHCLPLHHVHGIIVALMTTLYAGGTCIMMPQFHAGKVKIWEKLVSQETGSNRPNVLMAVPTMYVKLVEEYNTKFDKPEMKEHVKVMCSEKMRLMTSGSSALPEPLFNKWKDITGHMIVERFGSTEVGTALTNPLTAVKQAGVIDTPLDGYEVRIAKPGDSPNGNDIIAEITCKGARLTPGLEEEPGELQIRGPGVFKKYWNKPQETRASFTSDGWFKTGDTVQYIDNAVKILGRTSVDIIKSGGYKISALDVERHLLSHPDIEECVVVGLLDETWGQKVAAVIVARKPLDANDLREWCKERMPAYTAPKVYQFVESISKNVMGKVNKKELLKEMTKVIPA